MAQPHLGANQPDPYLGVYKYTEQAVAAAMMRNKKGVTKDHPDTRCYTKVLGYNG